jgi:hypothetical protein
MNKININYMNNQVSIEKILTESNKQFQERLQYIAKIEKLKEQNITWKEALRLSVIWYYIKYMKCRYNSALYNKIKSFE